MKLVALAMLGAFILWQQPWSSATATPRPARSESYRPGELGGRCPSGYRKSTVTARCVRSQARFPQLRWY